LTIAIWSLPFRNLFALRASKNAKEREKSIQNLVELSAILENNPSEKGITDAILITNQFF
jgi:hypothetical protein